MLDHPAPAGKRERRLLGLLLVVASLVAAAPATAAPAVPDGVRATIRTTPYGVPHITAADLRSLGFAYGWVQGHDATCLLADAYLTVNGERSRFLGPDGSYDKSTSNGTRPNNLESDLFYGRFKAQRTVERLLDPGHPDPVPEDARRTVAGFAEGYNAALADLGGPDGVRDPACKGRPWVRPITELDAWRRIHQLAVFAGQGVALEGIAEAEPLVGGPLAAAAAQARQAGALRDAARLTTPLGGLGSNAIALGGEATADGRGMLLGNPHFPWKSSERFHQAHFRVPGKLDAAGATILGAPLFIYGFNRDVAWTTTVSTARRFVPYQLALLPGDPTTYLVDGQPRRMTRTPVTVQVKQPDGSLAPRTKTFYDTEYGPVLTSLQGLPVFPWTPATAYALFDANAEGLGRVVSHYLDLNRARSVEDVQALLRRHQGAPFNTTVVADAAGNALFSDVGSVPNIDTDRYRGCATALGLVLDQQARVPVVDGARAACAPGEAPGAAAPGILPPDRQPSLVRRDFVENSNDSHWLVNPAVRLTGFSRLIGPEAQPQLFRTRIGQLMVRDELARGGRFTPAKLQALMFSNRNVAGEVWRDDLVRFCEANPQVTGSNGPVDVTDACRALKAWDLKDDLGSRGGLVVRLLSRKVFGDGTTDTPWRVPFDPSDPLTTPRGLNTESAEIQRLFADAVTQLRAAGVPFDAALGDWQYVERGGERIPVHGDTDGLDFNLVAGPLVPGKGWPDIEHGTSYTQVVHLGGRCPKARTVLAYSQSFDPTSRHSADQTKLFSQKRWLPFPLCERQVAAQRGLRTERLGGGFPPPRPLVRSVAVRRERGGRLRVVVSLRERATVRVTLLRAGRRVAERTSRAGRRATVRLRGARGLRLAVRVEARSQDRRQRVLRRVR